MKRLLIFLLPALFLAGCVSALSAETELTFLGNENWRLQVQMVLAPEDVQAVGLLLNQGISEMIAEMRASDVEASWARLEPNDDGNIPYLITAEGHGLEKLNEVIFENDATIVYDPPSEKNQIYFSYRPSNSFLGNALEETYTLRGGRILSSNGVERGGSVTWINPTEPMEATLTEGSRYPWLPFVIIVGLIGLLAAGIYSRGILRPNTSRPAYEYRPASHPGSPPATFCGSCGQALPAQAAFCPNCGNPRSV